MSIMDYVQFNRSEYPVDFYYGGGEFSVYAIEDSAYNNLFNDVPAEYVFWGGERYRKMFLFNKNYSTSITRAAAFIYVDSQAGDYLSMRLGTPDDTIEQASSYTSWHKTGVLLTSITGAYSKWEGPRTTVFYVQCSGSNSTGFYSGNRIFVSDKGVYDILWANNVEWISGNQAKITVSYDPNFSYSPGASVSSVCEVGWVPPRSAFPIWVKQTVPSGLSLYFHSNPVICLIGV